MLINKRGHYCEFIYTNNTTAVIYYYIVAKNASESYNKIPGCQGVQG